MTNPSKPEYFRRLDVGTDKTDAVWRQPGKREDERWDVPTQSWVALTGRQIDRWKYYTGDLTIDVITEAEAECLIAALNRGQELTMREVRALLERGE